MWRLASVVFGIAMIAAPACSQNSQGGAVARPDTALLNGSTIRPYERRFEIYTTAEDTTAPESDVGTLEERLSLTTEGHDTVLMRMRHTNALGGEAFDTTVYDWRTLALRSVRWHLDRYTDHLERYSQRYDVRGTHVSYVSEAPRGRRLAVDTVWSQPAVERGSVGLVLQAVAKPYDLHRTFELPVFYYSPTAEQLELSTLAVRVTGRERLHLASSEERETWVVEMSDGSKYWLDTTDRRLLMWQQGDEGTVVTYRLIGP